MLQLSIDAHACTHVYVCMYVCVCDGNWFLKVIPSLIHVKGFEFSFLSLRLVAKEKLKKTVCPTIYSYLEENSCIPSPRDLAQWKMKAVASRIWTQGVMSISNNTSGCLWNCHCNVFRNADLYETYYLRNEKSSKFFSWPFYECKEFVKIIVVCEGKYSW